MDKVLQSTEILQTRSIDDKVNFDAFIQYYKQLPPPIYKIFMETFDIGEDKLKTVSVYIDSEDDVYPICSLEFKGNCEEYIGLYHLLSIKESIEYMTNAFDTDDEIHNMKLVPFGVCFANMVLMVGIGDKNEDKLYIENTSHFKNDKRFLFVADNVFQFVHGLYLKEIDLTPYGINDYSDLYKNWNEDFWRIKGK